MPDPPLPPELARRIAILEREVDSGGFNRASWFWLLLFGVAIPAALLLWGWWT
jgi:hypothetical protein